jgi:DNA-binding NtrC family response regulator
VARILIIEDEENLRFSIARALRRAGHEALEAGDAATAWELSRTNEADVVLTDVNLEQEEDGIDLVQRLREEGFEGAVVVMTAYGTVENAVRAMKLGADDYLQKPVSLEELVLLVSRLLDNRRKLARLRLYERLERVRERETGILGESKAWRETLSLCERVASIPIPNEEGTSVGATGLPTILLLGETGTGKGLLARHIHRCGESVADASEGEPASRPFVHINCTALPPTLVESELFGHEKGAFTDAKEAREGLFEMANRGTIFLDEIGDMPLDLQSKLLTVLEEGIFRRVGGKRDRRVRARIIAATNQDLEQRAQEGTFRRDLLYRLNAFTVRIPPLRERDGDAVLMAEAMLARFAREYGRPRLCLTDEARRAIRDHTWPGNARELVNMMQRVAMLSDEARVGAASLGLPDGAERHTRPDVPLQPAASNGSIVFDFDRGVHTAEEVERALIMQALRRTKGNVSRAAKLISMQRSSLRYRIERFGLEDPVKQIARA